MSGLSDLGDFLKATRTQQNPSACFHPGRVVGWGAKYQNASGQGARSSAKSMALMGLDSAKP